MAFIMRIERKKKAALSWPNTLAGRGCLLCYTYALAAASGAPSSDRAYRIVTTR
jgi:hypothetical protein